MSGKHFIDKKPESILDWIAIVCAGIAFYLLLNNLGYFLGGFGALMGIHTASRFFQPTLDRNHLLCAYTAFSARY